MTHAPDALVTVTSRVPTGTATPSAAFSHLFPVNRNCAGSDAVTVKCETGVRSKLRWSHQAEYPDAALAHPRRDFQIHIVGPGARST
jgi:hypothetical protein